MKTDAHQQPQGGQESQAGRGGEGVLCAALGLSKFSVSFRRTHISLLMLLQIVDS